MESRYWLFTRLARLLSEFCYAERLSTRFGWTTKPWAAQYAAENVMLHPDRLNIPLRWKKPRRIFVNSMSDLFHEQVPDAFLDRAFATMAWSEYHTFQVLTKRPQRALEYLTASNLKTRLDEMMCGLCGRNAGRLCGFGNDDCQLDGVALPLQNVWLGVSAEDQQRADERIPVLLQTPAAVRFVSAEPLLGPIDLAHVRQHLRGKSFETTSVLIGDDGFGLNASRNRLDWVIVGGESGGPKYRRLVRPCPDCEICDYTGWTPDNYGMYWEGGDALAAVRSLRDQCQAAGVPIFFKQWGGPTPKSGGRLLDGRTWDEYPR